jgi:hypothetical protein
MDKVTIELTAEEAQLIPLLRKLPIANVTLESVQDLLKLRLQVDGLIEKVQKAFEDEQR